MSQGLICTSSVTGTKPLIAYDHTVSDQTGYSCPRFPVTLVPIKCVHSLLTPQVQVLLIHSLLSPLRSTGQAATAGYIMVSFLLVLFRLPCIWVQNESAFSNVLGQSVSLINEVTVPICLV